MKLFLSVVGLVTTLGILSGCSSIAYYAQSSIGHSKLMLARTPISKAMANAEQVGDTDLLNQLSMAEKMRAFAVSDLSLPDNQSYHNYVALDRDFPVYTVVAAPEFSLDANQWCYPVIGCASYRGYFAQTSAQRYARKMQLQGFETTVGGAPAYSTLGWFADPLLPSMLRYGEANLAETLFHELAHQQVYINGDSAFNEAFATVVGEYGAQRWLTDHATQKLAPYQQRLQASLDFNRLLEGTKASLADLYDSQQSDEQMRAVKIEVFDALRSNYERIKQAQWGGASWFDSWFETPVNNARLAAFSTYHELVPSIQLLLQKCSYSLPRFYATLSKLKAVDGQVTLPQGCAA